MRGQVLRSQHQGVRKDARRGGGKRRWRRRWWYVWHVKEQDDFVISKACAIVADSHESIMDGLVMHRHCFLKDWDARAAARPRTIPKDFVQ